MIIFFLLYIGRSKELSMPMARDNQNELDAVFTLEKAEQILDTGTYKEALGRAYRLCK